MSPLLRKDLLATVGSVRQAMVANANDGSDAITAALADAARTIEHRQHIVPLALDRPSTTLPPSLHLRYVSSMQEPRHSSNSASWRASRRP